jgi:hypothetical protein
MGSTILVYNISMDPINPVAGNPESLNPTPVPTQSPKDNHWITIASMALFVLMSLGIIIFLYYQNQQLKSMLATYQTQASPIPTATADPTAGWKTYTNTKYLYSLKYPDNFTVGQNGVNSPTPETVEDIVVYNPNSKTPLDGPAFSVSVMKREETLQARAQTHFDRISTYKLTPNAAFPSYKSNSIVSTFTKTTFLNKEAFTYTITGSYYDDGAAEAISAPMERKYLWVDDGKNYLLVRSDTDSQINQILSTFKFLGATSSANPVPTQKACTLEAKICPDGSSVGRTGPNCEFAPCP